MGTGAVTLNSNPTVTVQASTLTIGGIISNGTGNSFTKAGTGTLVLAASNAYTGNTTVTGGILKLGNLNALGSGAGATNISGGSVDINGLALNTTEQFNISGTGAGGIGAIVNNSTGTTGNNISRLTLTADASIGGTGRWDFRGNSPIITLNGFTLTKTGANQVSIVDANVGTGNIFVAQGMLSIEGASLISGAGTITYDTGIAAQFYQNTATDITRAIVFNGGNHIGNGKFHRRDHR